mmetsp:Transcript_89405/g.193534  ORF Transcript_89405/g.193534 Transcript_89405/m.193534 type:complete len:80 (+) Transcript_89405:273-512(+)
MKDLPRLVQLVKQGTNTESVNIVSNLGEHSGQTVFHPHIHVIPRHKGDNLIQHPQPMGGMIKTDDAKEVLTKFGVSNNL